jgi:hypothetical protein
MGMIAGELKYFTRDNMELFVLHVLQSSGKPTIRVISTGVHCDAEEISRAMGAMRDLADLIKELNTEEMR